jgi:hypothetical protein
VQQKVSNYTTVRVFSTLITTIFNVHAIDMHHIFKGPGPWPGPGPCSFF